MEVPRRWLGRRIGVSRPTAVVILLAGYVIGGATGRWVPFIRLSAPRDRVVFESALVSGGVNGPRASGFDRLRIPPETTDIHLSLAMPAPMMGERFEADLQPVDGGATVPLASPAVESSPSGAVAVVSLAPPPDGDYVIKLRRVAGGHRETVATHAFRVSRRQRVGP